MDDLQPREKGLMPVRKWSPSVWVISWGRSHLPSLSLVHFREQPSMLLVAFVHRLVVFTLVTDMTQLWNAEFCNLSRIFYLLLASLVLLAITVLTPYFFFIPKSCLAAVIICAVIFMVEVHMVKMVWRSKSKLVYLILFNLKLVVNLPSLKIQELTWSLLVSHFSFASLLGLSKAF